LFSNQPWVGIRPWANNIDGNKGTFLGIWVESLSWIFQTLDGYQSDYIFYINNAITIE
jgi:hypothetical protein